jgi:hypothetical protein
MLRAKQPSRSLWTLGRKIKTMKPTEGKSEIKKSASESIRYIIPTHIDRWISIYDDPERARVLIQSALKNAVVDGRYSEILSPALQRYFARLGRLNRTIKVSSLEFDMPAMIEASKIASGQTARRTARATPDVDGADGAIDYSEMTSEDWESLSDPGQDVTDPKY